MKFVEVNGKTYVRHWFRWYWLVDRSFIPIQLPIGKRRKGEAMKILCLIGLHKWHPFYDIEYSRNGETEFCERCGVER